MWNLVVVGRDDAPPKTPESLPPEPARKRFDQLAAWDSLVKSKSSHFCHRLCRDLKKEDLDHVPNHAKLPNTNPQSGSLSEHILDYLHTVAGG
jgi:hypothetical protein